MRTYKWLIPGVIAGAVFAAMSGCILSGTFVITEPIHFSVNDDFYFFRVNLTDNATWKEHGDKIDNIDAVGVELYMRSLNTSVINAYVGEYTEGPATPTTVPGDAVVIIDSLTLNSGTTVVTYKESLKIITGLDQLKILVKKGLFDFYLTSSSAFGTAAIIDSGKVIVTFSASD